VYNCDKNGKLTSHKNFTPNLNCSRFRGSASPIPYKNGYLLVEHEVIWNERRYYSHRLVYMSKNFKIIKLSTPFYFINKGIELCYSITELENNYLFTMGVEDKEAIGILIDKKIIESMLH